jgi:hypothetical protein
LRCGPEAHRQPDRLEITRRASINKCKLHSRVSAAPCGPPPVPANFLPHRTACDQAESTIGG